MRCVLILVLLVRAAHADDEEDALRRAHILVIGFGRAFASRVTTIPPTTGLSFQFQVGQQLCTNLHLIEELDFAEGAGSFGMFIGVRWLPFEARRHPNTDSSWYVPHRFTDTAALYVKATAGVALRDYEPPGASTTLIGPVASLALGHLGFQGRDFGVGFEVHEQLARYAHAYEHLFSFAMIVHVGN